VLDSYALLAFLFREQGCDTIRSLLEWAVENGQQHLITSVNWAEVRYIVERKAGPERWSEVRDSLASLPLDVVSADRELAELAGELKVEGAISLADCFAAALALELDLPVYTGDPEFRAVEPDVKVCWL